MSFRSSVVLSTVGSRKKPASHKYDVVNGIRIRRALQLTSQNPNRALILKEVIKLELYTFFKVRSNGRSMNSLASRDVKFCGAITWSTNEFLIHLCLSMSSEK